MPSIEQLCTTNSQLGHAQPFQMNFDKVHLPAKKITEAFSLPCQQQNTAKEISRKGWSTSLWTMLQCNTALVIPISFREGWWWSPWLPCGVSFDIRLHLLPPSVSALLEYEAIGGIIPGPIRSICSSVSAGISAGPLPDIWTTPVVKMSSLYYIL